MNLYFVLRRDSIIPLTKSQLIETIVERDGFPKTKSSTTQGVNLLMLREIEGKD